MSAETLLTIVMDAKDNATSTIKSVTGAEQQLDSTSQRVAASSSKIGSSFSNTAKHVVGAVGGIYAFKKAWDFTLSAIKDADEAEAATNQAFAAIRKDADATAISLDGLADWSTDFAMKIGQDDEAVLQLTSRLTGMVDATKLFGEGGAQAGIEQMTATIIDMSVQTGKSQTMIEKLFASIANDPAAALTSLVKLGVITKEDAEHYAKMAEEGEGAAVSQELLAKASEKYAGQAEAGASSSKKLSNIWAELKETFGQALLPLFKKVGDWFVKNAPKIKEWIGVWADGFETLVDMIDKVFEGLGKLNVFESERISDKADQDSKKALEDLFITFLRNPSKTMAASIRSLAKGTPYYSTYDELLKAEGFQHGGTVKARPGGKVIRIAEGGRDESVVREGEGMVGGRVVPIGAGRGSGGGMGLARIVDWEKGIIELIDYRAEATIAGAAIAGRMG